MSQSKKTKEFVINFVNGLSGIEKTRAAIEEYVKDESLIEHLMFFDSVFPKNELLIDELTADGSRAMFRARFKGNHEGDFNGIPPTHKAVEFAIAFGCEVENSKIISHWLIADQIVLMEQLGVMEQPN
jgi:predicted ester cyclase